MSARREFLAERRRRVEGEIRVSLSKAMQKSGATTGLLFPNFPADPGSLSAGRAPSLGSDGKLFSSTSRQLAWEGRKTLLVADALLDERFMASPTVLRSGSVLKSVFVSPLLDEYESVVALVCLSNSQVDDAVFAEDLEQRLQDDLAEIHTAALILRRLLLLTGPAGEMFDKYQGVCERVLEAVERGVKYARSTAPVVLHGETGTGKEIMAKAIHKASARCEGPFVGINCSAMPEPVFEAEMFGTENMGGGIQFRRGLLDSANGGTLLLDEIGDMPEAMQRKLLRVLQEGSFRRVGGTEEIRVDVRIVCASHMDLLHLVSLKKFREDLYYRLVSLPVELPPLRERVEDIPMLVECKLHEICSKAGRPPISISAQGMSHLSAYGFPRGNVRELERFLERLVEDSPEDARSIPPKLIEKALKPANTSPAPASAEGHPLWAAKHPLDAVLCAGCEGKIRLDAEEADHIYELRKIRVGVRRYGSLNAMARRKGLPNRHKASALLKEEAKKGVGRAGWTIEQIVAELKM